MLKEKKLREIISQCDVVSKLEAETAWAYAFDKPESVRKALISSGVDARSALIDILLKLNPEDLE